MIRTLLPPLTALAICASSFAVAAPAEPPAPAAMAMEQHWSADHAAMLDASLAGLRAGLKLTPDQDKLWPPFEAAIRDAAKLRMDQMKAMMDHAQTGGMPPHTPDADHKDMSQKDIGQAGPAVSPVDRLDALAQHMSNRRRRAQKSRGRRQALVRQPRQVSEAAVQHAWRGHAPDATWPPWHGHDGPWA